MVAANKIGKMGAIYKNDVDPTPVRKCLGEFFPINRGNLFGFYPFVGLAVSLFTYGQLMQYIKSTIDREYVTNPWFAFAFLGLSGLQVMWGCRIGQKKMLLLWMSLKCFELAAIVALIISISTSYHRTGSLFLSITNLLALLTLLQMAFVKYKQILKENRSQSLNDENSNKPDVPLTV